MEWFWKDRKGGYEELCKERKKMEEGEKKMGKGEDRKGGRIVEGGSSSGKGEGEVKEGVNSYMVDTDPDSTAVSPSLGDSC